MVGGSQRVVPWLSPEMRELAGLTPPSDLAGSLACRSPLLPHQESILLGEAHQAAVIKEPVGALPRGILAGLSLSFHRQGNRSPKW